jgi:hypothetical protein
MRAADFLVTFDNEFDVDRQTVGQYEKSFDRLDVCKT